MGCATTDFHAIRQSAASVELRDGVDRDEAIALAQYYIITHGLYDRLYHLKPFETKFEKYWLQDGVEVEFAIFPRDRTGITEKAVWYIYFQDKKGGNVGVFEPLRLLEIQVNGRTGDVLSWGYKK